MTFRLVSVFAHVNKIKLNFEAMKAASQLLCSKHLSFLCSCLYISRYFPVFPVYFLQPPFPTLHLTKETLYLRWCDGFRCMPPQYNTQAGAAVVACCFVIFIFTFMLINCQAMHTFRLDRFCCNYTSMVCKETRDIRIVVCSLKIHGKT